MNDASHSMLRPAADLIARLRHWVGLDRTAQSLKSPGRRPDPASASMGAEEPRQSLAGRWPNSESLLGRRLAALHPDTASSGKSEQFPVE